MLDDLIPRMPEKYERYIEPFFGGGALFFAVRPSSAIIADSNPELINMYKQIAENADGVIGRLDEYKNEKEMFYAVREQDWRKLSKAEAAARTIYLNRTCFNGLYRVNKQGKFNTPFGGYKRPNICDAPTLRAASEALRNAQIICGDYRDVLRENGREGDFVFLDPPYLPVTPSGDFKRYTKEQFHEKDHRELAETIKELEARGCKVILTNSNHPLVAELYRDYPMTIVQTRRHVNCRGNGRNGEDVIVDIVPERTAASAMSMQVQKYPQTRYMGSKRKLLVPIWKAVERFNPKSAVDLFSGSGVVGYMFKAQGLRVTSNDYMWMSSTFSKALIENNGTTLSKAEAEELLQSTGTSDGFVANTFKGLYYTDTENECIDNIRANIKQLDNEYKRAVAMMALIRACTKKRPRGIFSYTGHRYDDGRRDLQLSMEEQFLEAVEAINNAVFDNGQANVSVQGDALALKVDHVDLVYIDPPYYSKNSDNEYVRRYHFVEGLARDWQGVEIQECTKTKKFKSYPTPFSTETGAEEAFDELFERYADSVIAVSYSSNCLPDRETMVSMLSRRKKHVDVIPLDYTYGFGNQTNAKTHRNKVKEYLFIGY